MCLFNGNSFTCYVIFIFAPILIYTMKKHSFLAITFILLLAISCSKDQNTMILNGKISGLRKGTVLLQKKDNDTLVVLDSVVLDGKETFTFETIVPETELYTLQLNKLDGNPYNDNIEFFAEKGTIEIFTTLDKFGVVQTITGSKNNELLQTYRKMMAPINNKNLDLIAATFKANATKDTMAIDSLIKKSDVLLRTKYLRAVQFALNNKEHEIAPYIASKEISDATTKLLDTINNALPEHIKNSHYGKELQSLLDKRKQ